jgi:antitoxin (DNA-binding transcriptional repressor) of toxin-antitoxin stability system
MTTITLAKAQLDLPVLVERALAGEEIVIAAANRKVRLAPVAPPPVFDPATARRRGYGSMKRQFEFTDAFFEPLPEDELKFWEGHID